MERRSNGASGSRDWVTGIKGQEEEQKQWLSLQYQGLLYQCSCGPVSPLVPIPSVPIEPDLLLQARLQAEGQVERDQAGVKGWSCAFAILLPETLVTQQRKSFDRAAQGQVDDQHLIRPSLTFPPKAGSQTKRGIACFPLFRADCSPVSQSGGRRHSL